MLPEVDSIGNVIDIHENGSLSVARNKSIEYAPDHTCGIYTAIRNYYFRHPRPGIIAAILVYELDTRYRQCSARGSRPSCVQQGSAYEGDR